MPAAFAGALRRQKRSPQYNALEMTDWFRSISVLGIAFASVVALTFGLAAVIVPRADGSAQGPGASSPDPSGPVPVPGDGPVTTVGGVLAVTGDREDTLVVDREATDHGGYSLAGEQGRIYFAGNPLTIERISYDGLEFYVDPGQCAVTPGERHDPTGVAGAHLACEEIADIRDGGVVSMEGTVGVSADLLGLRGDLPDNGGTLEIGDQAVEFPFVVLHLGFPGNFQPAGGFLVTDDGRTIVQFDYDVQTHALELVMIEIDGIPTEIDRGACSLTTEPIGRLNPRTNTAELTIECPSVEMASGETVRVGGTLIADLVEPPQ
jgi:hypothetical protein